MVDQKMKRYGERIDELIIDFGGHGELSEKSSDQGPGVRLAILRFSLRDQMPINF